MICNDKKKMKNKPIVRTIKLCGHNQLLHLRNSVKREIFMYSRRTSCFHLLCGCASMAVLGGGGVLITLPVFKTQTLISTNDGHSYF